MNLKFTPPLDPGFPPAALVNRNYVAEVKSSGNAMSLVIGLERMRGLVSRYETLSYAVPCDETIRWVRGIVNFLLWTRAGWKLFFGGPKTVGQGSTKIYSAESAWKIDCQRMETSYGKKFQFVLTTPAKVSKNKEMQVAAVGHLNGCRIGFDLGASDYKASTVVIGEPVFTKGASWDSKNQPNSEYHYHHISAALHRRRTFAAGGCDRR